MCRIWPCNASPLPPPPCLPPAPRSAPAPSAPNRRAIRGVCYNVIPQKGGKLKYFKLVNAPSLETCAANLEAMRLKFLRMGGAQQEVYGAFQANFLFLQSEGVLTSTSLEGPRYVALVRTGDGRLAIPGAMPTAPTQ